MEKLYAEFLLWYCGANSNASYEALLNELFLKNEGDTVLLKLEEADPDATAGCFCEYWETHEYIEDRVCVDWDAVFGADSFDTFDFAARLVQTMGSFPGEVHAGVVGEWIVELLRAMYRSDAHSLHDCLRMCAHIWKWIPPKMKTKDPFCEPFYTIGNLAETGLFVEDEAAKRTLFETNLLHRDFENPDALN